jgi:charged multivesicular body protein 4
MSGWGLGWFGGGQAKKEAPKKAILQLRGQLEMLNKREKHLQNQMDEQDALARKHVSTNKQGDSARMPPPDTVANVCCSCQIGVTAKEAVRALARTDQFTDHDARTGDLLHRDGQHQQGDAGRHEECRNRDEADTRRPDHRQGRQRHVCILHLETSSEKLANSMRREDLREQHAIGEEISEAITSGVASNGIDEDELDEELAELQQEKLDEQMLNTGNVPIHDAPSSQKLPQAPNTNPKAPQRVEEDDEEEELRKLQAEMAM